ncbi:MAG: tRNA (adenosine(37)-N6)-threonylcarbamoyltransferase complex dimerization subunit type 1 TsaB [Candidatus Berkelbacteria bacterium]|nr:tRNA (adenosine(37)-N6)-threonylcarbamoyltransferase complex dimerization subunit type 1 TsaB [Candidatus Berkelbacteria bacterium]
MKYKLFVSSEGPETIIGLMNMSGDFIDKESRSMRFNQSEELLVFIDSILTRNNITNGDLSAIEVVKGPGSYTGLRVGLTTANFLAFSLDIPIISQREKIGKDSHFKNFVIPEYGSVPLITKSKSRL